MFLYAQLICCQAVFLNIGINADRAVGKDFCCPLFFFQFDKYCIYAGVLHLVAKLHCHDFACLRNDFTCQGVDYIFRKPCPANTVAQSQFFVELIASYPCKVVPLGVKEHAVQQGSGAFYCGRFAGTQLFVNFNQAFFIGFCDILVDGCHDFGLFPEKLLDLRVCAYAHRTNQHCYGNFSCPVYAYIEYIVGVCFIFQPCAAVGDYGGRKQFFADLVKIRRIIDTGRAHKLADDNTFRAIDDEGACFRHQGEIAHEDFLFLQFVQLPVVKPRLYLQGSRICRITFLTFLNGVLWFGIQRKINEFQNQVAAEIRNWGNVLKNFPQPFFQKPLVTVLLHFDQVGHRQDFVNLGITHPCRFPETERLNSVFFHLVTSRNNGFAPIYRAAPVLRPKKFRIAKTTVDLCTSRL